MSIVGKILDIFGPGGGNGFYARDFRNAYGFRPDQNPPRQKFQGYVSFVVNRLLYGDSLYGDMNSSNFRLRLGSLVRTATLPEVEFKTETKNAYNRKRIVNTGVEYQPVDIKVFDTINNEWLTMFMKYFTYHYMNPRNKQYNERDVGPDPRRDDSTRMAEDSRFGTTGSNRWDSNAYGYNVNELANFFERIDYVIYHGNKAVQYSLINPVLTRFRTGDIDYSSSDVMEFDMTFEYESFTIYEQVNFGLSEFDIARFENATGFTGPAFVPIGTPVLLQERTLETLSGNGSRDESEYFRTFQPQPSDAINPSSAGTVTPTDTQGDNPTSAPAQPPTSGTPAAAAAAAAEAAAAEAAASPGDDIVVEAARESPLPSVYGDRANFATPTGKEKSFIGGLLGDIADNALSAAIHGTSIKNAVINTAVGGAVQGITNVVRAPTRPAKTQPNTAQETGSGSTAESQYVPPSDDG
jgi:hypothetical protein